MELEKSEIFGQYSFKKEQVDTGSSQSQIALFTFRTTKLTEHLKTNKKDQGTRFSLIKLVGKRRKLLNYLKRKDINRYRNIIKVLGLRN